MSEQKCHQAKLIPLGSSDSSSMSAQEFPNLTWQQARPIQDHLDITVPDEFSVDDEETLTVTGYIVDRLIGSESQIGMEEACFGNPFSIRQPQRFPPTSCCRRRATKEQFLAIAPPSGLASTFSGDTPSWSPPRKTHQVDLRISI